MKQVLYFVITLAIMMPIPTLAFNPNFIISDPDLTNVQSMYKDGIQKFLESKSGTLDTYKAMDLDGKVKSASDIIYRVSQQFLVNPRMIMVMLQKEQSLISDPTPIQSQYDWATGYAVCDDCNVNSEGVSRFRGFAKQVDSMAQQFRLGYLEDLEEKGTTQTGLAPGKPSVIDGQIIVPANNATASLYTYTPHIEGNRNFWKIWQDWFDRTNHPSGSVLQDIEDNSLWIIQAGKRRFVPSISVLASYTNPDSIIPTDTGTILAYENGDPIQFPNYALVSTENGDVYLLVNNEKRRFQSLSDLPKFGYVPDEIISTSLSEIMTYTDGSTITYQTEYPQGALLQDDTTNSIYYVDNNIRHLVIHDDIKNTRYENWRVHVTPHDDLIALAEGSAITFPEGTLAKLPGLPTVYVISEEKRRPIIDEPTFLGLGYEWDDIIETTPEAISVHLPGSLIQLTF
jgi:hypothetical protein